jgi:hypothetical protein
VAAAFAQSVPVLTQEITNLQKRLQPVPVTPKRAELSLN